MKFHPTPLQDAYLVEFDRRGDNRGFFTRLFCEKEFAAAGLSNRFVQVNTSLTATRGTLRGVDHQFLWGCETVSVSIPSCTVSRHDAAAALRPGERR